MVSGFKKQEKIDIKRKQIVVAIAIVAVIFLAVIVTKSIAGTVGKFKNNDNKIAAEKNVDRMGEGTDFSNNLQGQDPSQMQNPNSNQALSGEDIEIITKKGSFTNTGKKVVVAVDDVGSVNPFVPTSDYSSSSHTSNLPMLPAPPSTVSENSNAAKVMSTTISGILYDKYSPSAIINIEGTDYLVKKNDVINNYKVLHIGQTQVIVQLGRNIYKAGVGELLSRTDLNYNTIANLNKKFGGNHEVQIRVKKRY